MLVLSLAIGSVFIPPAELWRALRGVGSSEIFRTILWNIRHAAHCVDRAGRRSTGRERRGVSGIVPQSTG